MPQLILLLTFCAFFGRNLYLIMAIIGIVAGLILVKHQQNILRLMAGTEYRFGSEDKKAPPKSPDAAQGSA